MDLPKDKCSILDSYKVGQEVTVDVNVRGSEYNGKFYVNLQGWKINASSDQVNNVVNQVVGQPFETVTDLNELEDDGLPF